MMNKNIALKLAQALIVICSLSVAQTINAAEYLVADKAAYAKTMSKLQAGDTIILKNGVWLDFEIVFEGRGTAESPITLTAESKGGVILSGQSNLSLAGEYLVVSGLVFKNGFTPTSSIISFRKSKQVVANHSRVTETVIDGFNNPERYSSDHWVAMYGKHNRFDHNHLQGKSNKGVTLSVIRKDEASFQNYHKIDHNYFGPRPMLGSNGGESLRVGTSHHSLSGSFTLVENNYFDRCDGEVEIISNKSGHNKFVGNVFFESRGTLTMRHGNDNLVENNVFLGNGVEHTGGIRVINKRQTIRNNYMEGLTGYRFGGALVVMNGVPNSRINRYHQVEDSLIEKNSVINSEHIQLAAGSDAERTAVPVRTTFKNNLIYNQDKHDPFTIYDDVSGITFEGNVANDVKGLKIPRGFNNSPVTVKRAKNGLLYADAATDQVAGAPLDLTPITKEQVGVSWYPKPAATPKFDQGKTIVVKPGLNTISSALKNAGDSDILSLVNGNYTVSKVLNLDKAITVRAKSKSPDVTISFGRDALFEIQQGGSLKMSGLKINGSESPDSSGNAIIRTQRRSMLSNYELIVENCEFTDLDVNHSFDFLSVAKGTFADNIEITNSKFKNITGAILSLDKESDDYGIYNAEYITIRDSVFESIEGDLVDLYRGGTDESTFGPHFELSNSTIKKVGFGKRNKSKSSILLHGVQVTNIQNNKFFESPALTVKHTVAEPITKITNNQFVDTPEIIVQELNSDRLNTAELSDNTFKQSQP
jgi:poly(beta-D-mannuronate) lyase